MVDEGDVVFVGNQYLYAIVPFHLILIKVLCQSELCPHEADRLESLVEDGLRGDVRDVEYRL